MSKTIISVLFLASCVSLSCALPFKSLTTTSQQRLDKLPDSDFKITLAESDPVRSQGFLTLTPNLTQTPILSYPSVEQQISQTELLPGATVIPHSHPRSSELFLLLRGTATVSMRMEGPSPRFITNTLSPRQLAVIPEGLIHSAICISHSPCFFITTFSTADPGFVALDNILLFQFHAKAFNTKTKFPLVPEQFGGFSSQFAPVSSHLAPFSSPLAPFSSQRKGFPYQYGGFSNRFGEIGNPFDKVPTESEKVPTDIEKFLKQY